MLVVCWSVKGGVGATTVAAALALLAAEGSPPATVVDLAGDLPACLGVEDHAGPGIAEWLAAGTDPPPDALQRLQVDVAVGLRLLPRGSGALDPDRAGVLAQLLAATGRPVVVDAGQVDRCEVARRLAADADRSILVTRLCLLGLRRALAAPVRPTGVVVVREAGRSLDTAEVERSVGVPVLAEVAFDPAVHRAVDAGLVAARLPRSFRSALRAVLA